MPSINTPVAACRAVPCDVLAHASVSVSAEELATLRRSPGTLGGAPFPTGRFKNVDEQTVVALAAVLRATDEGGLDPNGFGGWGVIAAPRYFGRGMFEEVFPKFLNEGAWGVSVYTVPNHSLHAISGTVSQSLKAHGPNLGVGGAPGSEIQAFLAAATMLDDGSATGVWVVLTGRLGTHEDPRQDDYEAFALALAPPLPDRVGLRLSIRPDGLTVEPTPGGTSAVHSGATAWRADPGSGPRPPRMAPEGVGERT